MNPAWLSRMSVVAFALCGGAAVAQVADTSQSGAAGAPCDPVFSMRPHFSLRAVAVNGESITPTNCVDVYPGDKIEAEIHVSNWARALSHGANVFQATLDPMSSTLSGEQGSILPLGWDAPVDHSQRFCYAPEDCDPRWPYCLGGYLDAPGLCEGPNHHPELGFFVDQGRADVLFTCQQPLYWFEAMPALGYYTAVKVLDNPECPWPVPRPPTPWVCGCLDTGLPKYAATLRLKVSDDACGAFLYDFSRHPGLQVLDNSYADYTESGGTIDLQPLGIEVDCDCNDDGMQDLAEIAAGVSPDCNMNGRPDACDIAEGAPDINQDGVPDYCKRRPRLNENY